MIVRSLDDGSLILINQTDHARLSGTFAAHWGNRDFEVPRSRASSIRAATYHDHGWQRYESEPAYDVVSRTTPAFYQSKTDEVQVAAYGWAIDWLSGIDPYAGLLISRHRTGLYRSRYGAVEQPASASRTRNDPLLDPFVAHYEAKQMEALKGFSEAQFHVDYQLLQFWDLFSLALCLKEPTDEVFSHVPTNYEGDGRSGLTLNMTVGPDREISMDPYPFDLRGLRMGYVYRHLPTSIYDSVEDFRRAYFGASPKLMEFTFV